MKLAVWTVLAVALTATGLAWSQSTRSPGFSQTGMTGQDMMGRGMMGRGGQMMGQPMMGRQGMMTGSMARHHRAMMGGIPEPYRSLQNPLSDTPVTISDGAEVYRQNCATCHGSRGMGDGPAGQLLNPRPANLNWVAHGNMGASDPFMYWAIAEGGQQFGTAMPSFKETLSSKAIWEVIDYLRHGLPAKPPHR